MDDTNGPLTTRLASATRSLTSSLASSAPSASAVVIVDAELPTGYTTLCRYCVYSTVDISACNYCAVAWFYFGRLFKVAAFCFLT